VFFSYSLSMIPPWRQALMQQALAVVAPSGRLLVVDFGEQERAAGVGSSACCSLGSA
jgi:S-adenosylmethionine-diacylgycerolhomoserine-N-methlytransferase